MEAGSQQQPLTTSPPLYPPSRRHGRHGLGGDQLSRSCPTNDLCVLVVNAILHTSQRHADAVARLDIDAARLSPPIIEHTRPNALHCARHQCPHSIVTDRHGAAYTPPLVRVEHLDPRWATSHQWCVLILNPVTPGPHLLARLPAWADTRTRRPLQILHPTPRDLGALSHGLARRQDARGPRRPRVALTHRVA